MPKNSLMQSTKFYKQEITLLQKQNEFQDIIKWDNQGENIILLDKSLLQQIVLPKYFKHAKYSSFLRQLNLYGFTSSKDQNSNLTYHHKSFTRDSYDKNTIEKKILIKDPQKQLGAFQLVQNELQSQLLSLQMEQNKIKQTILSSIQQQLQLRSNIKEFLQTILFIRSQGEGHFDQFIKGIQTIFQGLNPEAHDQFQHLISIVFQQFNIDEFQTNQNQSDIDEQSNSQILSPCPFGIFILKKNLNVLTNYNLTSKELSLDS